MLRSFKFACLLLSLLVPSGAQAEHATFSASAIVVARCDFSGVETRAISARASRISVTCSAGTPYQFALGADAQDAGVASGTGSGVVQTVLLSTPAASTPRGGLVVTLSY